MKRILFLILGLFALNLSVTQAQDVLKVHRTDNTKTEMQVSAIDSIYFDDANTTAHFRLSSNLISIPLSQIDSITFAEADHHHDDEEHEAAKIELILASGHFHGTLFHQNVSAEGVKFLKAVQTITLVHNETTHKWEVEAGSDSIFRVLAAKEGSNYEVPYGLWIKYYNAAGEEITGHFVENGEDQRHQHFFTPRNVVPTFDGTAETDDNDPSKMYKYVYMDTNPWNSTLKTGATLTGSTVVGKDGEITLFEPQNPVGLKGYFNFTKVRKRFDLNISLIHALQSKFMANGKTSPFYQPKTGENIDMSYAVPVVIYAYRTDLDNFNEDDVATYAELNDADKAYIQMVAKTFNITVEEAMADIVESINNSGSNETGSLWF